MPSSFMSELLKGGPSTADIEIASNAAMSIIGGAFDTVRSLLFHVLTVF